jgi:formylglycine-generating enzyme
MAPIRRADSCYWIDTTEVTEGQYAAYLAANPTPRTDALCSEPPEVDAECLGRAPVDDGSKLPMTCVDWCDADAFCRWAGKMLCEDSFTAIEPELSNKSDFVFACKKESGTNSTPYGPNCGQQACTVSGAAPIEAGTTLECWVQADDEKMTNVHDLIGNVEEWTQSCRSTDPTSDCTVRGGSFRRFDARACCVQKTELFRRRRLPTLGFRCCAYP